jgi:glycerophosphoryl diester phosphodiesterase
MAVPKPIERIYHRWADWLYTRLPQAAPSPEQARRCRIVAHRGEHDLRVVLENTLAAFDAAHDAGVWGIECDVRWTSDLEPVVFHDPDCRRLFGQQVLLKDLTWKEVQQRFPVIPSLRQVIERYGKQLHLMVEIKTEPYPNPAYQNDVLRELFSQLAPQDDYHLLSLDTTIFQQLAFAPTESFLPVTETNFIELSDQAIGRHYAGIAGHYLLITQGRIRIHHCHGQRIGTGFVGSRNCLYREINRGVDWIFSSSAKGLQKICQELASRCTVDQPRVVQQVDPGAPMAGRLARSRGSSPERLR